MVLYGNDIGLNSQFTGRWERASLLLDGCSVSVGKGSFVFGTTSKGTLYWHAACIMNLQQSAPFFFFSVFFYWHPAVPMCPTDNEALDFRILMIKGEHSKSGEDMWQCCWLLSWGHIPSITLNIGQQKGSAIYSNWSGHKREKKRRLGKSLGKRSIRGQ